MSGCLFCAIIAGDIPAAIVHSDDDVIAFRDISPVAPVHVLVVPRKHVATAAELATDEPDLAAAVLRVAGLVAVEEGIAESGYRLVANTGADAGQSVFHVHVHVIGGGDLLEWPSGLPTRDQLKSS